MRYNRMAETPYLNEKGIIEKRSPGKGSSEKKKKELAGENLTGEKLTGDKFTGKKLTFGGTERKLTSL